MPVGAGLGTFRTVYPMFEKPEHVSLFFVNRAHDDILELSLETGVVGLVLMLLFAVWLVRRSLQIWRNPRPDGAIPLDWSLARAGTIVVALLVAHSFVDYPLRTGGMMTIMAFACALLIEPLVVVHSLEEPRAVGVKDWTSGTRALETATTTSPTLRSMSPDTSEAAKFSAESPTALNRTDNTATPRPSTSSPSKPIESASLSKPTGGLQRLQGLQAALNRLQEDKPAQRSKSPEELQAALNRIQAGEPAQTSKSTEQALPPANEIQQSGMASAESVSLATARASLPSQLPEAAQGPSIPAERRWGVDVEWPEAWSNKAPAKDSAAKNDSQPTTAKKQE